MKITYTQNTKERIDKVLTEKLNITRSKVQKLIKNDSVHVNGQSVTKHHFLENGDIIEVDKKVLKEETAEKKFKPNKKVEFTVLHEDPNYLIINKQAGLLVHPTEQMEDDTLANGLIARYKEIKGVGEDELRPGIVHRLDKNVSGVLLVARNQEAYDYYKNLFKSRDITKIYKALVHNQMEQPDGEINLRISRSKNVGRMAAHPEGSELGKEARTEYEVITQFNNFSYLSIRIHTGRTHQIRAHMNATGHPIVGDPLYKQRNVKQKINIDRPFLHAYQLAFTDQDGQEVSYTSPLPEDLQSYLDRLV